MSDILKSGFMFIHILLVNFRKFTDHVSQNFQQLTRNLTKLVSFTNLKAVKGFQGMKKNMKVIFQFLS